MAGDWIKMRLDLMEDPAVMRMADYLGVREETVVGYCHAFWSWVSRQCHDGSVTGVTLVSLGRRINLPGFPELLCDVGWLEYDDSGDLPVIRIPNFERHLSQGAKSRALATNRKRSERSERSEMSRSERDKSVTREEKRREDRLEEEEEESRGEKAAAILGRLVTTSDGGELLARVSAAVDSSRVPRAKVNALIRRLRSKGRDAVTDKAGYLATTMAEWEKLYDPEIFTRSVNGNGATKR